MMAKKKSTNENPKTESVRLLYLGLCETKSGSKGDKYAIVNDLPNDGRELPDDYEMLVFKRKSLTAKALAIGSVCTMNHDPESDDWLGKPKHVEFWENEQDRKRWRGEHDLLEREFAYRAQMKNTPNELVKAIERVAEFAPRGSAFNPKSGFVQLVTLRLWEAMNKLNRERRGL